MVTQALSPNDRADRDRLLQPNSETAPAWSAIAPQPVDEVGVAPAELAQELEQRSSAIAIAPPENKTPKLNYTPVEEVEALSKQEAADRQRLEMKVDLVLYEAGSALRELRDKRLYRNTHKTWEQYCQDRFECSHRSADLKISAAEVVENLLSNYPQAKLGSNCSQILPTKESQCRGLASCPAVARDIAGVE